MLFVPPMRSTRLRSRCNPQRSFDRLHAMQFRATSISQVRGERAVQRSFPSDRDCPLDTARYRSLWHAGGTGGENDVARTWRRRLPPRVSGETGPGDRTASLTSREAARQVMANPTLGYSSSSVSRCRREKSAGDTSSLIAPASTWLKKSRISDYSGSELTVVRTRCWSLIPSRKFRHP